MRIIIELDEQTYKEIKTSNTIKEHLNKVDWSIRNGSPITEGDLIIFRTLMTEIAKKGLPFEEVLLLIDNAQNDTPDKPIADLINREALKDVIKPYKGKAISTQFILDIIDKAPPVDVSGSEYFPYRTAYFNGVRDGRATAIPQGKWELHGMVYYCSVCGHDCGESGDNFCGNCGADMRGGTKDNDDKA